MEKVNDIMNDYLSYVTLRLLKIVTCDSIFRVNFESRK